MLAAGLEMTSRRAMGRYSKLALFSSSYGRGIRAIVLGREIAAEHRLHSGRLEETRRHTRTANAFRHTVTGQDEPIVVLGV
jgi:hypothetical protein